MQTSLWPETRRPAAAGPFTYSAKEYKLVCLRETPLTHPPRVDHPDAAARYWRETVPDHPYFDPERECMVALLLDTRRQVKSHVFLAHGTLDTIYVRPGDVFRQAVVAAAAALILFHNHPSGDPTGRHQDHPRPHPGRPDPQD